MHTDNHTIRNSYKKWYVQIKTTCLLNGSSSNVSTKSSAIYLKANCNVSINVKIIWPSNFLSKPKLLSTYLYKLANNVKFMFSCRRQELRDSLPYCVRAAVNLFAPPAYALNSQFFHSSLTSLNIISITFDSASALSRAQYNLST